jgi:hypothetical protein
MNRLSKVFRLTALSAVLISSAAFADSSRQNDDDRYGQYRQDGDHDRTGRDGHKERKHNNHDDYNRNGKRHDDKDNRSGQYGSRDQGQYPRNGNDASRDRDYRSREEVRYRYEVYGNAAQRDQYGRDTRYADYSRAYYGYDNPRYDSFDYRAARNWSRQNNYYGFKQLPPGIRMNMARGKKVPYGISYRRLPPQYLSYLPRYRGYEWRGYGNDLVLVGTSNWIIAEVIRGALG